jgi:ribosomal-protein-alanine N-acetyltransferase
MTEQIFTRPPSRRDEATFLAAVRRSRKLHYPWVSPPASPKAFREYLARQRSASHAAFFVWSRQHDGLVGVVNLSEIVRGNFQSAYLGYYAFAPYAGRGMMREGLAQVITHAFKRLGLHRLEANIQPGNIASRKLVRSVGFRREGLSPRYLKVNGRWRDHERWAILAEDWPKALRYRNAAESAHEE